MANLSIIRDLCKEKNISLSKLAHDCNISFSGLQSIFAKNSSKIETLEKIADYLEVPVSYFFSDESSSRIYFIDKDFEEINDMIKKNDLQLYEKEILEAFRFRTYTLKAFMDSSAKRKNYMTKHELMVLIIMQFITLKNSEKQIENLHKGIEQRDNIIEALLKNQK